VKGQNELLELLPRLIMLNFWAVANVSTDRLGQEMFVVLNELFDGAIIPIVAEEKQFANTRIV